jgi:hypothetical protein
MTAPLQAHVDTPTARHRLVLLDPRRLRCLDCKHTLVLDASVASTSTSREHPTRDQACRTHPTEWAHNCRCCEADRKADEHRRPTHEIRADDAGWAARCRQVLNERRRTASPTTEESL